MDLVALAAIGTGGKIRDPHCAISSGVDTVGRLHEATTKVRHDLTGVTIEFENRIYRVRVAVDRHTAAETAGATALIGPDMPIIGINIDTGSRTPVATSWKISPVWNDNRVRIGQTLTNEEIGIVRDGATGCSERSTD